MKKNIIRTVCLFLICLLGCGKTENNEEPICGGVTDNTDYSASKTINSNNLESFSVGFYHEDKYDSSKGSYYTFILETDPEGRVILKDSDDGEGIEVDETVLEDVQTIIKKYDLAKKNGVDKTTAGLPPEYEACVFKAVYDSKETIYFRENSDPSSEWGREILDYFAEIFAKNGEDKYLTPKISGVINCFNLEIQKDNVLYQYNTEGENQIYRCIYDVAKEEVRDETYVDACPEYYEGILKIVSDMEIRDFENYDSASDVVDETLSVPYFDFHIEFEGGDKMSGASADPEVLSEFMPIGTELIDYIDNYINSQSEDENARYVGYKEIPIGSAYATSYINDDYNPENLYDKDNTTAYAEDADGDGIGQMVKFTFGTGLEAKCFNVSRIKVRPGCQVSREDFENNSRPLRLGFYFSNGRVEYMEFDKDYDKNSLYVIEFEPVIAKDCIMVIEDAVSGEKCENTCITEVTFYSQYTDDVIFKEHIVDNDDSSQASLDINIETYKGTEQVWSYETHNPLTEISGNALLTYGYDKVIVYDEQKIKALDAITGEVLWVNDDIVFPGVYSFDREGNLYVCGYFGSNLCVIDKDGNTIRKEDSLAGEEYTWATMLILNPDGNMSVYYAKYNDSEDEGKIYTTNY